MIATLLISCAASTLVRDLTPDVWHNAVMPGRRWLVYFALEGCQHCERLRPMMEQVANAAPELHVGRVDASSYNGLARTFGVARYPTVLLFDEEGVFYEFSGLRSPKRLMAFGRGAPGLIGAGQRAPTELRANVSEWWLMAEALWDPLMVAFKWALGIALGIKGLAKALLWCLEKSGPPKPRGPRKKEEGAAAADEVATKEE